MGKATGGKVKVGIFDPYLDTIGGGERYMMTVAEYLSKQGHQVDVFWQNKKLKEKIEKRTNLDLADIKFYPDGYRIFTQGKNLFRKFKFCRNYNLLFYLSDGSIPFLFAGRNVIHFQVPFHGVGGKRLLNKIKLRLIDKIVCNSNFTKKFIDQEYGVNSVVVYPPIDVENFKPLKKKNVILSVGRFDSPLHSKRQDIMIEVFRKMCNQGLSGWQLVLVGGASNKRSAYLNILKRALDNYPIKILVNVDFGKLKQYYGRAKIYWHAAGFGVDEEKEPEKVEHFGMSTVEAMAAGCVPVVVKKGGQKEIVEHAINGFLWESKEDLVKYNLQLMKEDELRQKLSLQAIKSSKKFSQERFYEEIKPIIL